MKQLINDFLVLLGLKERIGLLSDIEPLDTSLTAFGVCLRMQVNKIEYKYKWRRPFSKGRSAIKKSVPFIKHSNDLCKQEHHIVVLEKRSLEVTVPNTGAQ